MEEDSEAQLVAYEEQFAQVKELLEVDPGNEEYLKLAEDLQQLIDLTRQLVQLKDTEESSSTSSSTSSSDTPSSFSVGQKVLAQYSGDGLCYEAVIDAVNLTRGEVTGYKVTFLGYGNTEEVLPQQVTISTSTASIPSTSKAKDATPATSTTTSKGPKRKIVQLDEEGNVVIPKHLQIQPNDSEAVRAHKKKKIHAIRSAGRLQKINEEQVQKKNEWSNFVSTKGKQKKTGFFTGRKKESIFKSPDSVQGKVGVTGSGQAMTHDSTLERPKNVLVTKKKLALPDEIIGE